MARNASPASPKDSQETFAELEGKSPEEQVGILKELVTEARLVAQEFKDQLKKALDSAKQPSTPPDLEPLSAGNMTSALFEQTPGVFRYTQRTLFAQDMNWSKSAIYDRAKAALERAIGSDSENRLGYFADGAVETCRALGDFDKGAFLQLTVEIVKPEA